MQGRVGVPHQVLCVLVTVGAPGDSNAGGDKHFVSIQNERRAHLRSDALGHGHHIAGLANFIQQHGKLIAGQARDGTIFLQPRDGVRGAQSVPQPHRKGLEQQVASQMSEAVVDILEAIDAQQQDRKPSPRAPLVDLDPALQPVHEQQTVG